MWLWAASFVDRGIVVDGDWIEFAITYCGARYDCQILCCLWLRGCAEPVSLGHIQLTSHVYRRYLEKKLHGRYAMIES